jgi:hypothetical protein
MDREGVHRMEPQGVQNRRFGDDPRCVEDAKGWVQPFTNWQGWEELNRAIYALRCVLIWRKLRLPADGPLFDAQGRLSREQLDRGSTLARTESDLRTFHTSLARSRKCDRPALP